MFINMPNQTLYINTKDISTVDFNLEFKKITIYTISFRDKPIILNFQDLTTYEMVSMELSNRLTQNNA